MCDICDMCVSVQGAVSGMKPPLALLSVTGRRRVERRSRSPRPPGSDPPLLWRDLMSEGNKGRLQQDRVSAEPAGTLETDQDCSCEYLTVSGATHAASSLPRCFLLCFLAGGGNWGVWDAVCFSHSIPAEVVWRQRQRHTETGRSGTERESQADRTGPAAGLCSAEQRRRAAAPRSASLLL